MSLEKRLKEALIIVLAAGTFVSCGGGGGGSSGGQAGSAGDTGGSSEQVIITEGSLTDLGVYSSGAALPDARYFEFPGMQEGEYSLRSPDGMYIATKKLDVNSTYFSVSPLDFEEICDKCSPGQYFVDLRLKSSNKDSIIRNAGKLRIE